MASNDYYYIVEVEILNNLKDLIVSPLVGILNELLP